MKETIIYQTKDLKQFYDKEEAEINEEITVMQHRINELYSEIVKIQERCPHMRMTLEAKSDTGNYCKSDDEYWFSAECRSCGKTFRVSQSERGIVHERYMAGNYGNPNIRDPRVIIKK